MINVRRSIYWKLLFTFLACITVTALVMFFAYTMFAPELEIHPHMKKSLIHETQFMADLITLDMKQSSVSLQKAIEKIHQLESANMRVFTAEGEEIAAAVEEKLQGTIKISPETIAETLRDGEHLQIIFPRWVNVASVPLRQNGTVIGILQVYYPLIVGEILPQGIPTIVMLVIIGGITALFSRLLIRPIRRLTEVARQMSMGNLGLRVPIRTKDEIGELGKAFNEMSQRLADFHKSRSELLADVSHEIRSPLARIQTDAEILLDQDMEKSQMEQHLLAICEEIKNLDHLLEDLSMLTRLEYNQLKIEPRPSSIEELLTREISRFLPQIEEKGVMLEKIIAPHIPPLLMDPKRIGQVISNLLMNALRYTPQGGLLEVGAKKINSRIEVWVKDTGPGISKDDLPYIFDRFYRVDKSRSRSTGGTGLGLAIARQFVMAHNGEIRAESEPGKGTCFVFSLPFAEPVT